MKSKSYSIELHSQVEKRKRSEKIKTIMLQQMIHVDYEQAKQKEIEYHVPEIDNSFHSVIPRQRAIKQISSGVHN